MRKKICFTSKSMSSCRDFHAAPLLSSTWDFCPCHSHFLPPVEDKMLKFSTSDPFNLSAMRLTFSLHVCFILVPSRQYYITFSFGWYWESFIHWTNILVWKERLIILLQKNLRSAEECRQTWNRKCLNLPSPQFKIAVHISEECQISSYKKKDYCQGLNLHLSYKVMKKQLWREKHPDCTDVSCDFTRSKQKDNSFLYWSI